VAEVAELTAEPSTDSWRRVEWLDGVRALAACYVMFHHTWLMSYPGFPSNTGPSAVGWLVYGHLAVAVFIVVSGFSLTLSPARRMFALPGGWAGFMRRRFWRIVPPYWAALLVSSALVFAGAIGTATGASLTSKDVGVHALLLQDVFANTPPNGVFWSIAVEWDIYLFFPLLLCCFRKLGAAVVVVAVLAVVGAQGLFAGQVGVVGMFSRFTPQFFVLFVFGMVAVWLANRGQGGRVACCVSLGVLVTLVAACLAMGSSWVVRSYFWVDLGVGLGAASTFLAMATGHFGFARRLLSVSVLTRVGEFAFSLYLIHAPILDVVRVHLLEPANLSRSATFLLLLLIGSPLALIASYVFFLVFERPFLTIRSGRALIVAFRSLWARMGGSYRTGSID